MNDPSQYDYACVFEDDFTREHKCGMGWISSGQLTPTRELCNLKMGDIVIIENKGISKEYVVTWASESAGGKQWYAWVRPII